MRREPSEIHAQSNGVVHRDGFSAEKVPAMLDQKLAPNGASEAMQAQKLNPTGLLSLLFSVGGIYASLYVEHPCYRTKYRAN